MRSNPSNGDALVDRLNNFPKVAVLFLVLLLILSFTIHKIECSDFGWLLKTGEHIYETRQAPRTELFSFTAEGNTYIDSHWFFQLLLYISYHIGGIVGATLFGAAIVLAAFTAVFLAGYDKEKYLVAAVLMVAAIVMTSERYLVRPQLVTILFLAVYFLILERHKARGGRAIFLLPLFQLLWVNMHGLFVLGLILPAVYLGCGILEWKVKLPWSEREVEESVRKKELVLMSCLLAAMILESFLSPYTVDGALYPLTLFAEVQDSANAIAYSVSELLPTLSVDNPSIAIRYFRWMIWIVPISFILNVRRLNFTHVVLFAAFLYLGLIARRNLDLFAVIACPIAMININGFLDDLPRYWRRKDIPRVVGMVQLALAPFLMAGLIFMIFQVVTGRYFIKDRDRTRFGFGVAEWVYPVKAANFIEAADLSGEMLNDPHIGGYLMWRFFPQRRVYFDGRWEVYGDDFFKDFQLLCTNPDLFEKRVEILGIRYVVFSHIHEQLRLLISYMTNSPRWRLVYFDEVAVVFVRNISENSEVIERFAIDLEKFEEEREHWLARLPANIEDPPFSGTDSAIVLLTDAIPRTEYPFELLDRAEFYFRFGYFPIARSLYEQSLGIAPDCELAHDRLGAIYWREGLYDFALAAFEEVERLNPRSATNIINLGSLYFTTGQLDKAEQYFKRARKLDRNNADVSFRLGQTYLQMGKREKAESELQRALKLNSDLREASELLERMR